MLYRLGKIHKLKIVVFDVEIVTKSVQAVDESNKNEFTVKN